MGIFGNGLQQIPGFDTGYMSRRVSSMNKTAIGKLTDSNHLSMLHMTEPAEYDKKIITLYTQTSLYANDFLQMLQKSKPYYIDKNSDYWQWDVNVPYQFPKITGVPDSTSAQQQIGIDGQEFEFLMDSDEFQINSIITGNKMYGQQFIIVTDPVPYGRQFKYTATLVTENPLTDFVDPQWLLEGREYVLVSMASGEFDQEGIGLGRLGDKITLYESLGSSVLLQHKITKWADERMLRDKNGNVCDLIVYDNPHRNENGKIEHVIRWEPFIEAQLKRECLILRLTK
jgi:hypothetical protein